MRTLGNYMKFGPGENNREFVVKGSRDVTVG